MRVVSAGFVLVGFAGCAPDVPVPPSAIGTSGTSTGRAETTRAAAETSTRGSVSGAEQPEPDLPSGCGQYLDEAERELQLHITNAGATDLYLFDVDGCGSIQSVWQIQSEDGGVWPRPCGLVSCEAYLGEMCTSPWCTLRCIERSGIRLLPGATYTEAFVGRVQLERTLEPECAQGCGDPCLWARTLLDEEPLEVAVVVSPSPTCNAGGSCACEPGEEGWCETPRPDDDTTLETVILSASVAGETVDATFGP